MNVTLHQLRLLLTVAREGGVSRASRQLHLAQPTLSAQLRQMSEAVGLPLLERRGRGVQLTAAGQVLASGAERIEAALREMDDELAILRGDQAGHLRLAVVSTAEAFIPRLLGEFRRARPALAVSLVVSNRNEVVARLHEQLDDLYIMTRPPADAALEASPFLDNPLVIVAPLDHPLAGAGPLPVTALAEQDFVWREPGSGTRQSTEAFLAGQGLRPRPGLELGSNEAVRQAVASGLGIAALSVHALGEDATARRIAILPVAGTPIASRWHVVHGRSKRLMPLAAAFLSHLRQAAPALEALARVRMQVATVPHAAPTTPFAGPPEATFG